MKVRVHPVSKHMQVKRMTLIAMLAALGTVLRVFKIIPIPNVQPVTDCNISSWRWLWNFISNDDNDLVKFAIRFWYLDRATDSGLCRMCSYSGWSC